MKYYRILNNDEVVGYQTHEGKLDNDYLEEISEEKYNEAISLLKEQANAEMIEVEQSKDERISELERENASLLFQILTGEELSDV